MIVVKRRRAAFRVRRSSADAAAAHDQILPGRSPKVFRVEKQLPDEDHQDAPESVPVNRPALDVVMVPSLEHSSRPRRNRRLNGVVTIIRPVLEIPLPVHLAEKDKSAGAPKGRVLSPASGKFGNAAWMKVRFEQLMAKITRLELQARAAQLKERDAALRWIQAAILDNDIDLRELGL